MHKPTLPQLFYGYEVLVEAHSHFSDPCSHLQQRAKRHQHPSLKTPYARLTQLGEGCANKDSKASPHMLAGCGADVIQFNLRCGPLLVNVRCRGVAR